VFARRRHRYYAMMGTCVVLFVLAWSVVRLWSVTAAVAMCVVALLIPPVAAIVANRRGPEDRWWDEKDDQPEQPSPGPDSPGEADRRPGRQGHRSRPPGGSCGDPESDAWWAELDDRSRKGPE